MSKPKIFISHIHEEAALASAFSEAIRTDFLEIADVFCAGERDAIRAGEQWPDKIKDNLQGAVLVCVLCSRESLRRPWINMETGGAWVSGVDFVPILHAGLSAKDLPYPFNVRQAIDANSPDGLVALYGMIANKLGCAKPKNTPLDLYDKVLEFEDRYGEELSQPGHYAAGLFEPATGTYKRMHDGTIKDLHPITGTLVWTVPSRSSRPFQHHKDSTPDRIQIKPQEDYCVFCEERYLETPPEKARVVQRENGYEILHNLRAEQLNDTKAEFRRVPNLFEIVRYEYWRINYNYHLDSELMSRRDHYLDTPAGEDHVSKIIAIKRKQLLEDQYQSDSNLIDSLFGGSHDLIIARRHFKQDAQWETDRISSGNLSPVEHYQYFKLTIESIRDIYKHNKCIRYVAVFQNWLAQAGASVDHLHKQIIGIDEWGLTIERALTQCEKNKNFFNDPMIEKAYSQNLVFAENEYALALIEAGRRYPTIGIYSKSVYGDPTDQTNAEIRGMSDLVHACHAALGEEEPCNEEWYYKPLGARWNIPWHVLILSRANIHAGFEHSTRIYINPLANDQFCTSMINALGPLIEQKKIAPDIKISHYVKRRSNPLRYTQV